MRMIDARPLRDRLRAEHGFTMLLVLGVLMVVTLATGAVFVAVQSDSSLSRNDLNGKRAYAAAQAGVQAYLYLLNDNASNSQWWETCSNDTKAATQVPGVSYPATYSYQPVLANGVSACDSSNPVGTLIDSSTGTLRVAFTGTAGLASTPGGVATRTIVASFKTQTPLSYLWYTVHETIDPSVILAEGDSQSQANQCSIFYYSGSGPPSYCEINWFSGDTMNGPMYTQDQLLISSGANPSFGRGPHDEIISQTPTSSVCAFSNCQHATFNGKAIANPPASDQVPLPADNGGLVTDATNHGQVFTGATTITIHADGKTATVTNCPSASATANCTQNTNFSLTQYPIIYAANGAGCNASYNPTSVSYTSLTTSPSNYPGNFYGPCGDIYVSGTYLTPLTLTAADDIIVTGNLQTTEDSSGKPTGSATLGLVANQYVRVKHSCTGNPAVTIDGAILTLAHSFFVDNYTCGSNGGSNPYGSLTIHGALAQYYRGAVGTSGPTGYLKNYNYDDRLGLLLPPYLFDLQSTAWVVFRETSCATNGSQTAAGSCNNPNS